MASSAPTPELSLIPTFISRLDQLRAIASDLRELTQPRLDELQSLLEQAQKLVEEPTERPITPETESASKSFMATPAPAFRTPLKPIFIARLDQLKAIALGLRELPQPRLDELQSLLERAQKLVEQLTGLPISSKSESDPEP